VNGFNAVDIVAAVWLLVGLWRGVRQGFAGALLRLLAVAAAVGVGLLGYAWLGAKMSGSGRMEGAAGDLLAFFLITVAVYAVLRLLGMLLKNTLTFAFKGRLEPVGGGLVGLLVSACVVILLLLLAGQWPQPQMQRWFAEEAWCGRLVAEQLGPGWQQLAQRYPALRLPEGAALEPLDTTVQDVQADAAQAVTKTGKAVDKQVKRAKQRVNDAVVEGTKK
jgi:uncharacterized membrane protein required for colicin V production